jgi:hypothetical protein
MVVFTTPQTVMLLAFAASIAMTVALWRPSLEPLAAVSPTGHVRPRPDASQAPLLGGPSAAERATGPPAAVRPQPSAGRQFHHTMDDFGRKLFEASLPQRLSNDGVQRARNKTCCLTRYLTSAKIPKKYGLTNVMLFAASMMAYAGLDNRAVLFPERSPTDLEQLLNLEKTEALLSVVNVRLATRAEVQSVPRRLGRAQPLRKTSAWRVGIHLGYRALSGSMDPHNASTALSKLKMNMGITKDAEVLSYGDFFLRFPFFAIRPLDDCFFLRRMVFSDSVLSAAMRVVQFMEQLSDTRGRGSGLRVLALHLRLEPDAYLLDKSIGRVPASELRRFLDSAIAPLVVKEGLDVVYVCSGPLDEDYVRVLRGFSATRLVLKDDVPGLDHELRAMAGQTTNHFASAVDLTIAEFATVAVSTSLSTFFLAVLSRRCPSPRVAIDVRHYAAGSVLFRAHPSAGGGEASGTVKAADRHGGGEEVFSYDIVASAGAGATLGPLVLVGCKTPWKNHCFFDEPR